MRNQRGALRSSFLPALILLITLLFLGSGAKAQKYMEYNNRYLYHWVVTDSALGIPKDTFAIPASVRSIPHIAGRGDSLYLWSTALQKWKLAGGGNDTLTMATRAHVKHKIDSLGAKPETDPVFSASDASGITIDNIDDWNLAHSWGNHVGLYPQMSGSYSNPSWITALAWSKITGTPTTFAGYGLSGRQQMAGPLTLWNSAVNPSTPQNGDIWYRTTDHLLLLYSNGTWVSLLSTGSSQYIQNQTGAGQAAGFKVSQFSYLDGGFSAGTTSSSISVGTTNAGIFNNHQLQLRYSGSVAADRGPSLAFRVNNGSNTNSHVGAVSVLKKNATSGSDLSYMSFGIHDGSNLYEAVRIENGDLEIKTAGKGLILISPNGTRYKLTVSDAGTLTTTAL